jgi:hypothetical protein
MTNPVDPFRRDRWDALAEPPQRSPLVSSPRTPLAEAPDLPDVHPDLLARAVRAQAAPRPLLAMAVGAPDVHGDSNAPVQRRLDAFRASATPTYHTSEGDVATAAPFRMWGGYPAHERTVVSPNERALKEIAHRIGMSDGEVALVKFGRASPEQVRRLTQALLNAGKLPTGDVGGTLDERVRTMMFDHGIGMDCAGYTQRATLAVRGVDPARAGFADVTHESLSQLESQGYRRVPLDRARAGDVLVFGPPQGETFGHRAIVYDARPATEDDLKSLEKLETRSAEARGMAQRGHVSVLVVDSSYGCGGNPKLGGVLHETWYHDEQSGRWARENRAQDVVVTDEPYGHPLQGVFRAPEVP